MSRSRPLSAMREEAYQRADTDGALDRHPRDQVDRYLNQGGAAFFDILIAARGPEFLQASPYTITTTADTSSYDLPAAFYLLVGVRFDGEGAYPLVRFGSHEEAALRDSTLPTTSRPTHYQVRRTSAGTSSLVVLPEHDAGLTIKVDYVPCWTDLVDDDDTVDGINGWEEYMVTYAALRMAQRDDEMGLADRLERELQGIKARIQGVSQKRDMHEARRVKDVRGLKGRTRRYPPA